MPRLTDDDLARIKRARELQAIGRHVTAIATEDLDNLLADLEEAREHRRILREALMVAQASMRKLSVSGEESLGHLQRIGHRLRDPRTRQGVPAIESQEAVQPWLNATEDADFAFDKVADALAATEGADA